MRILIILSLTLALLFSALEAVSHPLRAVVRAFAGGSHAPSTLSRSVLHQKTTIDVTLRGHSANAISSVGGFASLSYGNSYGLPAESLLLTYYSDNQDMLFQLFHQATEPLVRGYLRSMGVDQYDIDDIVQHVFLKIARSVDKSSSKFDPRKGSLRPWMKTISRHSVADFYNKKNIESVYYQADPDELLDKESEHSLSSEALIYLSCVDSVLKSIPSVDQDIFSMHVIGHSFPEIHNRLGLVVQTDAVRAKFNKVQKIVRELCFAGSLEDIARIGTSYRFGSKAVLRSYLSHAD